MTIETGKCQEASISHFFSSESILIRLVSGGCTSPVSIGSASPSSLLMTVVFSRLNSEMTLSPDRSENGKNFARKSKILPQKTVFWERDKRRSKSVENFEKFFLGLFLFLVWPEGLHLTDCCKNVDEIKVIFLIIRHYGQEITLLVHDVVTKQANYQVSRMAAAFPRLKFGSR